MKVAPTPANAGEFRTGLWKFDGRTLDLPWGRGRLEKVDLEIGLAFYRAEFEVEETCVMQADHDTENRPLVGSFMHLIGRSFLLTPDGATHEVGQGKALLLRVAQNGTRFLLPGGQVVRHVGVAIHPDRLAQWYGGSLPESLACFSESPTSGACVRLFSISNRLRRLKSLVFTGLRDGPAARIALGGICAQIMAEALDACHAADAAAKLQMTPGERFAVEDVIAAIRARPQRALSADEAAASAGLTRHRLLQVFTAIAGQSFAAFQRSERLNLGRRLIEDKGFNIPRAAEEAGYNHVTNFSVAYRRQFGETPGDTQRRAARSA
ncbi:AraC family transcriptional regulator [Aquabacter sp. CN5-332]|uniref:helix-turn-helix domain-containing protein n=1 Tax=Aquabacter sp. CN5-332 TaxID=3156608 RepID=UPI0032B55C1D